MKKQTKELFLKAIHIIIRQLMALKLVQLEILPVFMI